MANQRQPQPPGLPQAKAQAAMPKRPAAVAAAPPRTPVPSQAALRMVSQARAATAARPATKVSAVTDAARSAAAPAPATPRPPADPVIEGLIRTIVGLEAVVEEETLALNQRQAVDLDSFSNRKSQGLMELNRCMRHLDPPRHQSLLAPRLESLRTKLAANQEALKMHLEAVREISSIIANAIREQESDGTYSHTIRRPEAAYGYD